MTAKRKFELTVEKSETYSIRRTFKIVAKWCSNCGCEVRMSGPEDAAKAFGITARAVYLGIEAGKFHFIEPPDGLLLVCLRSIDENPARPQI